MSLIRPELSATLRHWGEALGAAAVVLLGAWGLWRGQGWMVQGFGALLLGGGCAALYAAVQRARFRNPGDGPGVVRVTERRIAYLGPFHGGAVSLPTVAEIALVPDPGGHCWVIAHAEGAPLVIPTDAAGAEALFDAFTSLPGLDPALLARHAGHPPDHRVVIWSRRVLPEA